MPAYAEAARAFGAAAAGRGLGIVYGGGRVGLMGAVADAALAAGGEVVGAIPQELVDRELAHPGLSELHVVGSLHERKALMAELSDAFVALPGGFGTLDELMEQLTWSQLGLHAKPVGLLDVEDYWRPLIALARHATQEGFVRESDLAAIAVADDAESLLDRLDGHDARRAPAAEVVASARALGRLHELAWNHTNSVRPRRGASRGERRCGLLGEGELEHVGQRLRGGRAHVVDRERPAELARHRRELRNRRARRP